MLEKYLSLLLFSLLLLGVLSPLNEVLSKKKPGKKSEAVEVSGDKKSKSKSKNQSEASNEEIADSPEDDLGQEAQIDQEIIEVESGNIYDIMKLGGPLMVPLSLLLIITLTLVIERVISYTKHKRWNTTRFEKELKSKAEKDFSGASYKEVVEEELEKEGQNYLNQLERGLDLISGIGNLAPLVGFLGTVIGMINAFTAIASSANVNAKVVAGGIKEALITTASGLIIAVPALISYYIFMHIVNNSASRINIVIQNIVSQKKSLTEK